MVRWQLINCQYNTDFWLFWRKCNISEKIFKFPIAKWWQSCYIYYVIKINNGLITENPRLKPCSLKSPLALTREAQLIWLTKQTLTSGSMQICLRVCAVTLKIFQLIFWKILKNRLTESKIIFIFDLSIKTPRSWSEVENWKFGFLRLTMVPSSTMVRTLGFQPGKFGSTPNGTTSRTTRQYCLERANFEPAGVKGGLSCLAVGPATLKARSTGASPVHTPHAPWKTLIAQCEPLLTELRQAG